MKLGIVGQDVMLPEERLNARAAAIWFAAARFLLISLLAAAPLAFGAVQLWAWTTLGLGLVLVLLLWTMGCLGERRVAIAWSPVYIPAGLFLALIMFQFLTHHSLDFVATRESLVKLITYLLIFALAGTLLARASNGWWRSFGLGVSIYVFAMSLFGIIQNFSSPGEIYWTFKPRGYIFGPYVNRNHYGGLMELLLPLVFGFFLSLKPGAILRWLIGFTILIGFGSVVMCGSRGGLISILVEMLIFAVILFRRRDMLREHLTISKVGMFLAAGALMAIWLLPETVSAKYQLLLHSPDVTFADRKQMSLDALHIFREHPFLGTGLGSFETVYPQYQSYITNLVVDHAHNDYVELLSETGILGALVALLGLGTLFWKRGRKASDGLVQSGRTADWISISALVSCCGLLLHSYVDFNLHIPANAAIFFALCGVAASVPANNDHDWHLRSAGGRSLKGKRANQWVLGS